MSNLSDVYEQMIFEKTEKKNMKAGKDTTGDLEGPAKEVVGDQKVEGVPTPVEKKTETNKGKTSKVKENTSMSKSFKDLYNQVMLKEEENIPDIENPEFATPDEGGTGEDIDTGTDMEQETEETEADLFRQLSDVFAKLADKFGGEMTAGPEGIETDETPMEPPVGEAVSQPEPKPFSPPIKNLQAPRKLGGVGVKVASGKASAEGTKEKDGKLQAAPAGVKPGDKKFMKVAGKGPAVAGKDASFTEG